MSNAYRVLWAAGCFWILTLNAGGISSTAAEPDKKVPAADAAGVNKPTEKSAEAKDIYQLPEELTLSSVGRFLIGLQLRERALKTIEEEREHAEKAEAAMKKLLEKDLSDPLLQRAVQFNLQAIIPFRARVNEQSRDELTAKFLQELEEHPRDAVKRFARSLVWMERVKKLPQASTEDAQAFIAELAAAIKQVEAGATSELATLIGAARNTASLLEQRQRRQDAQHAIETFIAAVEGRDEPVVEQTVERWKGTLRRLTLPGQAMEVQGQTIDGEAFDLADWKGKVVLVDFWATWCGPCVAEMPHVKEMYEHYHDKGFEVIGVSLDREPGVVSKFIESKELPWTTLYDTEATQGWDNRIARHYGISAIPTAILIDQEGHVCHLNARGRLLTEELARLLGPIEPAAAEKSEPTTP